MALKMDAPGTPRLPADGVDLWWEKVDDQIEWIPRFWDTLPEDERKRAQRFRIDRHRERFIVQRGRLREILGGYLGTLPGAVRFCKGSGGKPAIEERNSGIRFNLSHCGGHALYGFAWEREVGVDVEAVRPKPKAEALVNRFFSPNEKAAFQKLHDHEKPAAFFAGWTRKEAYVKGVGKGLRFPLDQFDVSMKPGDQNALLHVDGAPEETKRWVLRDVDLGRDFRAALAVEMTGECSVKDIAIRFRSILK